MSAMVSKHFYDVYYGCINGKFMHYNHTYYWLMEPKTRIKINRQVLNKLLANSILFMFWKILKS